MTQKRLFNPIVLAFAGAAFTLGVCGLSEAAPRKRCGCSKLRITHNRYLKGGPQKYVRYSFKVDKGENPNECVLVQTVKGQSYYINKDGEKEINPRGYFTIPDAIGGAQYPGNIDSRDKDPVVWSRSSGPRAMYYGSGRRKWVCDTPSFTDFQYPTQVTAVDNLQFEVGLYCASDVPREVSGPAELPAPLEKVTWEVSNCWHRGIKPTHPGFNKPCPSPKRKPRRPYTLPKWKNPCPQKP